MNKLLSLIFCCILFLSSCSPSIVTNADYDHSVDFQQYRTYTLAPINASQNDDPVLSSTLVKKRINRYLTEELNKRGYKRVESGGDLLVSFQIDAEARQTTSATMASPLPVTYWGWGARSWFWGGWAGAMPYPHIQNYTEGRLIVNFTDSQTNELVWQGWAIGEVDRGRKAFKNREEAIRKKVKKLMEEYPFRAR